MTEKRGRKLDCTGRSTRIYIHVEKFDLSSGPGMGRSPLHQIGGDDWLCYAGMPQNLAWRS